jgi:hypothetical protein
MIQQAAELLLLRRDILFRDTAQLRDQHCQPHEQLPHLLPHHLALLDSLLQVAQPPGDLR